MTRLLTTTFALAVSTFFAQPAQACLWDDEVYQAEATSLPCLEPALLDLFPLHGREYWQARDRAARRVLAVDPFNTWALDMAAVAQLKLDDFAAAESSMKRRAEVEPDAYATHANLGTLYTFTGAFEQALVHIDAAMKIEPQAHFGREKYHRALVVYLRDLKSNPALARENFLKIPLSDADRLAGTPAKWHAALQNAGFGDDVFDALVSMITVYGAKDNPHVHRAAADLLALRGSIGPAAVAYTRAAQLKHPAAASLRAWSSQLVTKFPAPKEEGYQVTPPKDRIYTLQHPEQNPPAKNVRKIYAQTEAKLVAGGLAVWTEQGRATLYAEQERLSPRCPLEKSVSTSEVPAAPASSR